MTAEEAYNSLAKFIQDEIYENQWTSLNPLQTAAVEAVLEGKHNLLLMAGTAQGKTEAALMPALTVLDREVQPGVGILYISPLKALINDQFERMERMLRKTEYTITKWHGDASDYRKAKLLEKPGGILQMTPESLEAMLCLHPERIKPLFANLRFIIIDEIHYFIHQQRGVQLLLLLERMQRKSGSSPIRIGLSATIQNQQEALNYLDTGSAYSGKVLSFHWQEHHVLCSVTDTRILKEEVPERYYKKIIAHTRNKRVLLFANSRRQCESIIAGLKKMAKEHQLLDTYYVHHGSIAKGQREETEKLMKKEEGQILTGTTLTLELGIDLGDLDEVIQASDPLSISSMVQRLGRSGRRSGKSAISFHLQHREDQGNLRKLDLQLIRSIAMIELYFREHYMEESIRPRYPFRLLAHTVLSVLCEKGCLQPHRLAREVLELKTFALITQNQLRDLLLYMIEKDVLKRYEDGALGLSDQGEILVNRLDFFAVFEAEAMMTVYYMGAEIGTVDRAYHPGNFFYLGGIIWEVLECDLKNKKIIVEDADGEADIWFSGSIMQETDETIMRKMHEILSSDTEYPYLDAEAKTVLASVREKSARFGINQEYRKDPKQSTALLWCPTISSQRILTLFHIFQAHDIPCERIYCREILYGIRLYQMTREKWKNTCRRLMDKEVLIDNAYAAKNLKIHGKYYDLLPDALKAREILNDVLDLAGARETLKEAAT